MRILYTAGDLQIGQTVCHKTDKEKPMVIVGAWFKEVEFMGSSINSQWVSPLGLIPYKEVL